MADFGVSGIDDLILTLQQISEIPEPIQNEMLNAQADVLLQAQKAAASIIADTGETARSLKKNKPRIRKGIRSISITFSGSRKRGNTITRNAEIAFVNEFGKRNVPARNFIRTAIERSASACTAAAGSIYDKWLEEKGL